MADLITVLTDEEIIPKVFFGGFVALKFI